MATPPHDNEVGTEDVSRRQKAKSEGSKKDSTDLKEESEWNLLLAMGGSWCNPGWLQGQPWCQLGGHMASNEARPSCGSKERVNGQVSPKDRTGLTAGEGVNSGRPTGPRRRDIWILPWWGGEEENSPRNEATVACVFSLGFFWLLWGRGSKESRAEGLWGLRSMD